MATERVDFTAHRHPLLAVACPKCGAPVDAYCRRPSGHSGPLVGAHAERKALADAVWLAQGDWPITKDAAGRWVYAVGEQEDAPPEGQRPARPEAAKPPAEQWSLPL